MKICQLCLLLALLGLGASACRTPVGPPEAGQTPQRDQGREAMLARDVEDVWPIVIEVLRERAEDQRVELTSYPRKAVATVEGTVLIARAIAWDPGRTKLVIEIVPPPFAFTHAADHVLEAIEQRLR